MSPISVFRFPLFKLVYEYCIYLADDDIDIDNNIRTGFDINIMSFYSIRITLLIFWHLHVISVAQKQEPELELS